MCINSTFALIFWRCKFCRMGGRPRPNVLVMPSGFLGFFLILLCYCVKAGQWTIRASLKTWAPADLLWLQSFLLSAQITSCQLPIWCSEINRPVDSLYNCATFFGVKIYRWVSVSDVYRNTIQTTKVLKEVWSWCSPLLQIKFLSFFWKHFPKYTVFMVIFGEL